MPYPEYSSDVMFCKKIHKKYGKSFYFGTFLFEKSAREATCILYAFFRYPDEYVDTYFNDQKEIARTKLLEWQNTWKKVFNNEVVAIEQDQLKILRAARYVFKTYHIPFEYSEAFIGAMLQDTIKQTYETYKELEEYMYGSAVVVGLMMTHVLCSKDQKFLEDEKYRNTILSKAQSLGEGFQMTNFLRDISDDLQTRGRIYLPQEDLVKYGVTTKMLTEKTLTTEFISMMKFEINRTKELYVVGDEGIPLLPKNAQKGIRVARVLYSSILNKIEDTKYNIFRERIHLSFVQKLFVAIKSL